MNDTPQPFDAALQAALHDLPVPPGLAERLIEATASRAARTTADAGVLLTKTPARSRRNVRIAATSVALAGLVLLAVSLWPQSAPVVSANTVAAAFPAWLEAGSRGTAIQSLPRGYSFPSSVNGQARAYQSFRTAERWPGIAVELAPAGRPPATLLIVRSRARFQVPATPLRLAVTAGKAAAAWQVGDLLYVLVVEERGQRLDDFLIPMRQA